MTTQTGGAFNITGDYTCPSSNSQVYLYSIGGDPGLGDGANPSAGLLASLGTCNKLSSLTYVVVNEISTIATAYAIAGYATDATDVSSSGSALAQVGIANAFASTANLETLNLGQYLQRRPGAMGFRRTRSILWRTFWRRA